MDTAAPACPALDARRPAWCCTTMAGAASTASDSATRAASTAAGERGGMWVVWIRQSCRAAANRRAKDGGSAKC